MPQSLEPKDASQHSAICMKTWYNFNDVLMKASITRSSQPLVGIKQKRSIQDEKLIEAIFDMNQIGDGIGSSIEKLSLSDKNTLFVKNMIIDARPTANAMANRAMGAGFESTEHYRNCKRMFMGIENIHVMRDSLLKFIDAIQGPDLGLDKWYSNLENTDWLKHIKCVLDATMVIVKAVADETSNVLIHCSDGWDRTAQLSALSQLCLDPYYRTIKGFQVIIEKEWVSFGHKFLDRSGHLAKNQKASHYKESSPVFLQFLDCLYQIMKQFPAEFEYNEQFLIELLEHLYSCQYGNFLVNCEHDRDARAIDQKTFSVWLHLSEKEQFLNPLYKSSAKVIMPQTSAQYIEYWVGLYSRFEEIN
jgi:hypothetical protein